MGCLNKQRDILNFGGMAQQDQSSIVLFDGVCNLCNGFVQFLIKNDHKRRLRFASLQSDFGAGVQFEMLPVDDKIDSVLFLHNGHLLLRSDAAIEILKTMGGVWILSHAFYVFPRFIRNRIYDLVAKNRYRWFGKRSECMLPSPELEERFIK